MSDNVRGREKQNKSRIKECKINEFMIGPVRV